MFPNLYVPHRFYICTTIILCTFEIKYIQKQNLEEKRKIKYFPVAVT